MACISIRNACLAAAFALVASWSAPALAQYPERGVTLIVPYGAGGGTDITARMLAKDLEVALGKPVTVENRAGGGAGSRPSSARAMSASRSLARMETLPMRCLSCQVNSMRRRISENISRLSSMPRPGVVCGLVQPSTTGMSSAKPP